MARLENSRKEISVSLKNNSEKERLTKELLQRVLKKYDLQKWTICRDIIIEEGASGYAFPVIRLSVWRHDTENGLLAQFLHEQIHWIEKDREEQMEKLINKLKMKFPDVPIGRPEGGDNENSTYKHLIVCRLEFMALKEFLGEHKAKNIVLGNKNYTWIRKTVINNGTAIDSIIKEYFPGILTR